MNREDFISLLQNKDGYIIRKYMPDYFSENRVHDPDLLEIAWIKLTKSSGLIASEFLNHYSQISEETAKAVLNKIQQEISSIPVSEKTFVWFHWWGSSVYSGLTASDSTAVHMQTSFTEYYPFFAELFLRLSEVETEDMEMKYKTVLPWLNLVARFDFYDRSLSETIGDKMLELCRQFKYSREFPLHFLSRIKYSNQSFLFDSLLASCRSAGRENVKRFLKSGQHIGKMNQFVYINSFIYIIFTLYSSPSIAVNQLRNLKLTEEDIWLISEAAHHDISNKLTNFSCGEKDFPDWLAEKESAVLFLRELYSGPELSEGQRRLDQLLKRIGSAGTSIWKRQVGISEIPERISEAIEFIGHLKISKDELHFGNTASEKRINTAENKMGQKIPEDLRILYTEMNGILEREISNLDRLVPLQKKFQKKIQCHLKGRKETPAVSENEIDLKTLNEKSPLFALGEMANGDFLFLPTAVRTVKGNTPVIKLCHDRNCVCCPEAESVGFLAARIFLSRYSEKNGIERNFQKIMNPEIKIEFNYI
ncbi:MAG TPA: hypothetical protein PL048_13125 [Leptospiraceae bacterium]|nr:hypothetical protein [Leptospiraceae bacterium]HMY66060.1 hypothetical protein [Leptospiraceae bacterium]HMZ59716.1 hypothetical protein [Leptospiraceae bacterium]HNF12986.1 hypothetical protein [Leptospiraceae bacterium]HNF27032.1 hypothetical protein [Leptospiraceae bacterium]